MTLLPPSPAIIDNRARYRGCLLGGAIGDALGAPVEFLSRNDILVRFGPQGITDFAPAYGVTGAITDDTQMTLFTAEGLLRAHASAPNGTGDTLRRELALAYLRWLATQGEPRPAGLLNPPPPGPPTGLLLHRALHARRGPGNTCLTSLRTTRDPGAFASNDSKGCGGVMRAAPAGLYAYALQLGADTAFDIGVASAAITHGHPSGQLPSGALALIIERLCAGATLDEAIVAALARLRREPDHGETVETIELALQLAAQSAAPASAQATDHPRAIARLGEGWVAEEALAIALYCALVAGDFTEGVVLAVNHDGDADSTGAIAGNLLGAMLGEEAIPGKWRRGVELADVIGDMAAELYALRLSPGSRA